MAIEMTARERILNCFNRKPIDRAPVSTYELCGYDMEAWYQKEPSYQPLMQEIREKADCFLMADPIWHYPAQEKLTRCEETETTSELHTDRTEELPDGTLHSHSVVKKGVHTIWQTEHLLKSPADFKRYLSQDFSALRIEDAHIFEKQEKMGENGVMLVTIDDPVCVAIDLIGMTDFLLCAMTEREQTQYFLDGLFEIIRERLRLLLTRDVRNMVFRISGPEVVTPPYLPFSYYPDFVTKYLKVLARMIKDAGGFVRVHSHGRVATVLDEIASTDADAVDPLEPPPDGDIPLVEVKKRYGERLILFGNIELKELENGTEERVEQLVKQAMEEAKGGSGFVLLPTATPINVPLSPKTERNFLCYLNSGLRYGRY